MSVIIVAEDGISSMRFEPSFGATASSLVLPGKHGPRELLYCHDNFDQHPQDDLAGGWPLCFPVCARVQRDGEAGVYLYQGQRYRLPIHGFAWHQAWSVQHQQPDSVVFSLCANEATRAMYPFEFELELRYCIEAGQLQCQQRYINHGVEAMPFYAGFHPYFLTPVGAKADVTVDMSSDYRLCYNADYTDVVGRDAALRWPLSATDPLLNEQLSHVDDCRFAIDFGDGDRLHMNCWSDQRLHLFPYIQTYTMTDKPFVCVEPWMDHPNAINTVAGCQWLAAGESVTAQLSLQLLQ